jgi:N5-(cytidine 5'-diphosphoramidyl)-L-glutamine hydrolase
MKNVLVTQRVEYVKEYDEKRDSLDQRWSEFLFLIGIRPIILPNNLACVESVLDREQVDGVLFTGGNSLAKYGGHAPERDNLEISLLKWALLKDVPLIGVCRGMHVLQDFYDVKLVEVDGHIARHHKLIVQGGFKMSSLLESHDVVNSYHRYGAFEGGEEINVVARSSDGVVMAIEHPSRKLFGVMWHCEREQPFSEHDKILFKKIFC